jgi:phenylacetate-CoA ligase
MDLYGTAFRRVLFPLWEGTLRGRPTFEHLRFLERTQWRSLDELQALQLGALRRLLRHAHDHVPYYRDRMAAVGLAPEDVRGIEDLARLPLLTRAQAAESAETRRSLAAPLPVIAKSTSGSTGSPLAFAYDWGSEHWRQATKLRGYGWGGYFPGARALHYWGLSPPRPTAAGRAKVRLDRWIRRDRYLDCVRRDEPSLLRAVEEIRRYRPQVFVCYTQGGADLARFVLEQGLRTWDSFPVLCAAERLFTADRAVLEEAFGPEIFETYGSREVMLIASECEAHDGLHLSMENLLVELVVDDRKGGLRAARPGESGEVVITDLHNFGMPFIRYASGDRAVAGPPGMCACGRPLLRLGAVEGRQTETLRDGRGGRIGGLVFNVVFGAGLGKGVRAFQAVQHPDDSITLKIVPSSAFDDAARAELRAACERQLVGLRFEIELVPEIPVGPNGKRKIVILES